MDMNVRGNRGLATVEFTIALPVLLILLLGVAELGRAFYHYNTLTRMVRDGVRYAAGHSVPNTLQQIELTPEVVATTRNLVVYGQPIVGTPLLEGMSTGAVQVLQDGTDHVAVTATYVYTPLFATIPLFATGEQLDMSRTMNVTVTMRAL